MDECISGFCKEFEFPAEAETCLTSAWDKICAYDSAHKVFLKFLNMYECGILSSHGNALHDIEEVSKDAGVHPYTADMLFYILLTPRLRLLYTECGLPYEIYYDSMLDLRCKLFECHEVYGIWGSFVAIWFSLFFRFKLYGLGRLEFAPSVFRGEYSSGENSLHDGDFVIDVHIPSRGRLPHDKCIEAYQKAADFYADKFEGRPAAFICESWLLYPAHYEFLPADSNIIEFMKDFNITESGIDKEGSDLWRIFGREWDGNSKALPRDTTLRRLYAERLDAGLPVGWGKGVFFFRDGKVL